VFDLSTPLRALVVALAGVGLAWLWFHEWWWIAVLIGIMGCFGGVGLDFVGRKLLPARPVLAARFMEWWILTPAMIAALASGAVAIVTVALAVPDSARTDTKTLIGALTTGITGFVTTAFIGWVGDEKDSRLGDHIRDAFREAYKRVPDAGKPRLRGVHYFRAGSPGERWAYSDEYRGIQGWGRPARRRRATGIAAELRSGASNPA
jgi:hypothetical protein